MTKLILTLGLGVLSCLPAISEADGATVITSVPFTVSAAGTYLLESDLKFSQTKESPAIAITVLADHVVIDLGGYMVSGPGAGTKAELYGISSPKNNSDLVIRNGTIYGFTDAISTTGRLTRIRNIALVANKNGITLDDGLASEVSHCYIVGLGFSTTGVGIHVPYAPDTEIKDNQVAEFHEGVLSEAGGCGFVHNFIANCVNGLNLFDNDYYQGNVVIDCQAPFAGYGKPIGHENGGY
jgi:hypothetical protein